MVPIINDVRATYLEEWLKVILHQGRLREVSLLAGDASFRRYFRVYCEDKTFIAMDAPPEKEDCKPYVAVGKTFHALGLRVPEIFAENLAEGFLLIEDFGDQLYFESLTPETVDVLYQAAFQEILTIQTCKEIENYKLPSFDEKLYQRELQLFEEWYLRKFLNLNLTHANQQALNKFYNVLIENLLLQPEVCVHRDFHSKNLMVLNSIHQPGILDFQDAVYGPITYDVVSLLRDCYIDWPLSQVQQWALQFQAKALSAGTLVEDCPQTFLRWFDEIGLQRHLKCLGIFARLSIRDNKKGYLKYIPRIMEYINQVLHQYPEYRALNTFLIN